MKTKKTILISVALLMLTVSSYSQVLWSPGAVLGNNTTNQYVGIGTATPNNLIQVSGLINFDNTLINTSLGYQSGNSMTTGVWNTAIGYQALPNNTTGNNSTAIGYQALFYSNGLNNVAIGSGALFGNYSGYDNVAVGVDALVSNGDGNDNSALGEMALEANDGGSSNTAIGHSALRFNYTGNYNTAVGLNSLAGNTTGSENSAIGFAASVSAGGYTNATAIGARARVGASNSLVLGSINTINGATANTNVGIGTTVPLRTLHVQTTQTNGGIRITQTNSGVSSLELYNSTTGGHNYALVSTGLGNGEGAGNFGVYDYTATNYRMFITTTGKMGIGTNTPGSILQVNGNAVIGYSASTAAPTNGLCVSGNVLINKTSQTNSNYKLDINGSARANEIVVNTTGADFVFDDTYSLMSLIDLEKTIKETKHLPGVPSAIEMQENGMSVGEISTVLLQKIEELTLYLIDQNKRIEVLEKENQSLKNK